MDLNGAQVRTFTRMLNNIGSDVSHSPSYMTQDEWKNQQIENHQIRVPHFQRPYKWEAENISQLIKDWRDNERKPYFSGTVVTVNAEGSSCHDLIDGQQRTTTLYLANFVYYLILKERLKIYVQKKYSNFAELCRELENAYRYVFRDSQTISESVIQKYNDLNNPNFSDERKTSIEKDIMNALYEAFGIVIKTSEDEIEIGSRKFFINKQLRLTYNRDSYNKKLNNVLSSFRVSFSKTGLKYEVAEVDFDEQEKVYIEALKTIFTEFVNDESLSKPRDEYEVIDFYKQITENIKRFICSIQVCLMQTGNPRDAYILFEVLNDRSLALEPLDLIKNDFFKTLCENTSIDTQKLDENIEDLDNQWGDIFSKNATYESDNIAYFSATYLTRQIIKSDKKEDIKDALNTFLSISYAKNYTMLEAQSHFDIFKAVKCIIKHFDAPFRNRDSNAILKAYKPEFSAAQKAYAFLWAKKQSGVLAGFVTFILRQYFDSVKKFEENKFLEFLNKDVAKSGNDVLTKVADALWKISVSSKDYTSPKAFSDMLINSPVETIMAFANTQRQFELPWVQDWSYDDSRTLNVKVLFAMLFTVSKNDDGSLERKAMAFNLSEDAIRKLHLDHLEPKTINKDHRESYFEHDERERIVNSLGNMLPLPSEINIEKSNRPFSIVVVEALNKAGIKDHWLGIEAIKQYEANNSNDIPTEEFFRQRRDALKNYFMNVLTLPPL